jgi:hypothetical protein
LGTTGVHIIRGFFSPAGDGWGCRGCSEFECGRRVILLARCGGGDDAAATTRTCEVGAAAAASPPLLPR